MTDALDRALTAGLADRARHLLAATQMNNLTDNFNGDTPHLIRSIEALLELDANGALVPHGVPGHARTLLEASAVRLAELVDDASYELGRLLNHIHGDHGQTVAVHGWKKAATDALAKVSALGVPASHAPRPAIDADTLAGVRRYLSDVMAEGTPNEQAVARTVSRMLAEPPTDGAPRCGCAARLNGRADGNVHFEGCPHFVPPNDALRRALGDIIGQTVVAERMGYTDPQDWQEKFQRVRQIARDALGVIASDGGQPE